MSAQKHRDGFVFICDECGESIKPPRSTGALPFIECFELAKEKGWRAFQEHSRTGGKDWVHRCPNC
jgi:hypothetical protein